MNGVKAEFLRDPFRDDFDDPICRSGCVFGRKKEEIATPLREFRKFAAIDQMSIGDDFGVCRLPEDFTQTSDWRNTTAN